LKTNPLNVAGILMELNNGETIKLAELVSVLVEEKLKPGTKMCPKCKSIKHYKEIKIKGKDGFDQCKYVCSKCNFNYISDEVMFVG
jgi:transposase-like protein